MRRLDEAPLRRWASFDRRPTGWLHHSALTRDRMAKIDRLFPRSPWRNNPFALFAATPSRSGAPRTSMAKWLEALVDGSGGDDAVAASRAALQVAASIPEEKRRSEKLGNILLAQSGDWCEPDSDTVFLPASLDGAQPDGTRLVHAALAADEDTATPDELSQIEEMPHPAWLPRSMEIQNQVGHNLRANLARLHDKSSTRCGTRAGLAAQALTTVAFGRVTPAIAFRVSTMSGACSASRA